MIDAEGHNRKMQELPIWEKPLLTGVVFRHNQRDIGGKELWQKKAR